MHRGHDTSNQSKIRTKTPPPFGKVAMGWKSGTITPPNSPSPMNIPPLHLYTPHNQLAKETQGSYSPETAHFHLQSVLSIKSLLYLLTWPPCIISDFFLRQEPFTGNRITWEIKKSYHAWVSSLIWLVGGMAWALGFFSPSKWLQGAAKVENFFIKVISSTPTILAT